MATTGMVIRWTLFKQQRLSVGPAIPTAFGNFETKFRILGVGLILLDGQPAPPELFRNRPSGVRSSEGV